ncbi:MAG: c-type cytochrome [Limisphaerales bacterium]
MKSLIPLLAVAAVALSLSSTRAADVKVLYEKSCVKCHGADGKGQTKLGQKAGVKDLSDAKVQAAFTDDQAFKTIKEGKKDTEGKILMKPIEGATDDEIKALVAHSRSLKK